MIVYILTFIGTLFILHGFLNWQLFFISIGFAWNFTVLIMADKLNLYEKSISGLKNNFKIWNKEKKDDDNIRY